MAIAGLVLGILSIIGGLTPVFCLVSWIFAVIGLVLSVIARKNLKSEGKPYGMATGGFICSIIGIVLSIVGTLITVLLLNIFSDVIKTVINSISSGEFNRFLHESLDTLERLRTL